MNFRDWYTDTMDIYRVAPVQDGALTRQERTQIAKGVRCRQYCASASGPHMTQTAASVAEQDYVQCDNAVDVQAGDELHIHQGGALGKVLAETQVFAGEPQYFFEPFGAVAPGLAHQEIRILREERVK